VFPDSLLLLSRTTYPLNSQSAAKVALSADAPIVLLVEDNPIHARLVSRLLCDAEPLFAVETVDYLEAGLSRLKAGGIDVVLLDLVLPDSQGMDTFSRLKQVASEQPVLILTGLDDEALAEETVAAGACEYIVKTQIDGESLSRSVWAALR
jgi:glutamate dehydrogenase (NAD(P)+)